MKLKLKVWRQSGPDEKGRLVDYVVDNADEDMSFLELIDVLNEKLILEGEALRDDEHFTYAAAWEYTGAGQAPVLHKEDLTFEYVTPSQRSYK